MDAEKLELTHKYNIIIKKQQETIQIAEIKYTNLISGRMAAIEQAIEKISTEQAMLAGKTGANLLLQDDSKFDEQGLFPSQMPTM